MIFFFCAWLVLYIVALIPFTKAPTWAKPVVLGLIALIALVILARRYNIFSDN